MSVINQAPPPPPPSPLPDCLQTNPSCSAELEVWIEQLMHTNYVVNDEVFEIGVVSCYDAVRIALALFAWEGVRR